MGTSRSLASPLGVRSGWRKSWLPALSRESKEGEFPFQVLCSCCLMFTGVLLSILLLRRLKLCLGCNLELCFVLHGQCFHLHTTWEVSTAPAALGQGAFPRGRDGEGSSTGGRLGWVLQIKTVCSSVLEKTLPKHLWADFYVVKGVRHFAGNEGAVFHGGDGSVQVKASWPELPVLLPPASVQCWWSTQRDPHHWALQGWPEECALKHWLLCLFLLSYVEKNSQTASSTAVFSVLGKIMKGRQWRILSQNPVP